MTHKAHDSDTHEPSDNHLCLEHIQETRPWWTPFH